MAASHSLARPTSNIESSNLAWISHLGGRWKFQLIFFRDSCHQLSTADNSCQKLMKIKINLESWNLAKISPIECTWKFQSNFIHISCHQLSTAVNSWLQVLKADENENPPRKLKFGTYINFSVHMKISVYFFFIAAVISCQQLKTGDENENQPRAEIWYMYYLKGVYKTSCSKFSVSAVISYQQLSTIVKNRWKKINLKSSNLAHILPLG